MCKIQVIRKEESIIKSDNLIEFPDLKKVSIDNIPYYLTIDQGENKISFVFTFFDSYDIKSFHDNNSNLFVLYGERTGRLYSVLVQTESERLDNKMFCDYKKIIESYIVNSDLLKDIRIFFKIMQDSWNSTL